MRLLGRPGTICRRVALMVGAPGARWHIDALGRMDVDVAICGEIDEWDTNEYVHDAIHLGKNKALLVIGHAASEEAGMAYLAEWLRERVPGVPIAQMARETGALTVGIVTKPFLFEGRRRMKQAEAGITEMRKNVDTMIVVPNERLLAVVGKGIPFQEALKKADEVLLHATQGIASLITSTGIINVDFADVRTVMQNGGAALMGTGIGRGENRALEAAQQAISSPLLDNVSIAGAMGVLINIIGGDDLTLGETTQINDIIHDAVGDDAEIIFGAGNEPAMHGEVRVTVIATGFDRAVTGEQPVGRAFRCRRRHQLPRAAAAAIHSRHQPAAPVITRVPPRMPQAPQRPATDVPEMEIPTFIRRQMD